MNGNAPWGPQGNVVVFEVWGKWIYGRPENLGLNAG